MDKSKRAKYVLIAVLMLLLFNYPVLSTANKPLYIGGFPILYAYLATVWALSILLLIVTVSSKNKQAGTDE